MKQEAGTILTYFRGSFVRALKAVFPNIGLIETKFVVTPRMLIYLSISLSFRFLLIKF